MEQTEQLDQWTGEFGNDYVRRCEATEEAVRTRTRAWADILRPLGGKMPSSILEVGCNVGINQRALPRICDAELFAVEPNDVARQVVLRDKVLDSDHLKAGSALNLPFDDASMDLCFTTGVLIHIAPDDLAQACSEIYRVSRRYVLCGEYFSQKPEVIPYQGKDDLLFKRDFGSYWLDNHDLVPLAQGFLWQRTTGMDDVTWWLFEKRSW